jgi:outer membrane protein
MKYVLRRLIPGLLVFSLLGSSALAQGKIATVDLRKLFDNYWKKKQVEAQLKERQADMEKEDANLMNDYKRAKDDYNSLVTAAQDQAFSPEEKEKKNKAAADKLKQVRDLEETIVQYRKTAGTTLKEQADRLRSNILADIRKIVDAKAKTGGFSMVVDTAAESANQTPIILFTNNENDLTDAVLLQLNANAPTDLPKTDEKPVADDKKKDGKK